MTSIQNGDFGIQRTSVTASMLPRFMSRDVRLIGNVVKNTGNAIEVNTGEDSCVRVQFKSPLDEPLEGLIDIYGKVVQKNVVEAESYIIVPQQLSETFDLKTYNEAITFIGSSDNPWTQADS